MNLLIDSDALSKRWFVSQVECLRKAQGKVCAGDSNTVIFLHFEEFNLEALCYLNGMRI